jgi:hypothetical protein
MDRVMSGRILIHFAVVAALGAAPFVPAKAQTSQDRAGLQRLQD